MRDKDVFLNWEWVNRYIKFQNGRRGEVGDYIVKIMTFIRDHPGCRTRELQSPNIPPATLFRLLKELVKEGIVEKKSWGKSIVSTYRLPEGAPDLFEFRSYEGGYELAVKSCEALRKELVEQEMRIFDARIVLKKYRLLDEYESLHPRNKEKYVESNDGPILLTVKYGERMVNKIVKNNEELAEFKKDYEINKSKGYYQKR